jgi:hypothetical protein
MEVGSIDALTPGYQWDWPRYVAMNETIEAGSADTTVATERRPDGEDEFSAVWE